MKQDEALATTGERSAASQEVERKLDDIEFQADAKLVVILHTTARGSARRMWNVAAVAAALRVVLPKEVAKRSQLYD